MRRRVPASIAVDWGPSGVRAWALDDQGSVLMKARSARDLSKHAGAGFEAALMRLISPWLLKESTPVLVSGVAMMDGVEDVVTSPRLPATPTVSLPIPVSTTDTRASVHVLPGLHQASPADRLDAEEAVVRGVIAEYPGFTGALCLPVAFSKWILLQRGTVRSISSFLSGELVSLLVAQSSLTGLEGHQGLDEATFQETVSEVLREPESIMRVLGALKTGPRASADIQLARLSGAVIGAELAATRSYWADRPVIVVGHGAPARHHSLALAAQGCDVSVRDDEELAFIGLKTALTHLVNDIA